MILLAPLMFWAALAQAPPASLSGIVVDPSGRPVAGARVWLADQPWFTGTVLLGEARADAEGRFSMPRPAEARGNGPAMPVALWAYAPGHRLGLAAFPADLPPPEAVVRIEVGPPAKTVIRLESPDPATPIGGTVEVFSVHRRPGRMPRAMIKALAAPIGADGVATLDGYLPEDILGLDARTEGFGTQTRETYQPTPGDRAIRLRPVGGLSGKVVADDAAKLKGWKISASTAPDDEPDYSGTVGYYREETDDQGRFRFPTLPSGHLTIRARPPEGVAYLADEVRGRKIEAGKGIEVDVPARRAVIVEGYVREAGTGTPIPGVSINLFMQGRVGSWNGVRTDDKGHYAQVLWPGEVSMFPPTGSPEHFLPPGTAVAKHAVPEGVERFEWPAIEMIRGVAIRGVVLDARGKPVADATVSARYPGDDMGDITRARASTRTDPRGAFRIPGIAAGEEVRLTAKKGGDATPGPATARAGAEAPITLTLARSDAVAIRGRVLGPDGRPVPDALVTLRSKATGTGPATFQETPVQPEGVEQIRTGADGTFETPRELEPNRRYRAEAAAAGMGRAQTDWTDPPATTFPDLRLRRARGLRTVVGRVVDRAGEPIAGVVVSQSGDGPRPTRSVTDDQGRSRVAGVLDDRAFLFARMERFRFQARPIGPGAVEVEIVLAREAEAPAPAIPPAPAMPRAEEKELARRLVASVRARLMAEREDRGLGPRLLAAEARLDPDRMIGQVQDQVIRADAVLADVALGLIEDDPHAALELIESDRSDPGASAAYLALFDALPPREADLRRDLLGRAERRARAISVGQDAMMTGGRAEALARVADRLLDLGDRDRAGAILRDVRAPFEAGPAQGSSFGDAELAGAFARVDLPAALAYLGRDQETRRNNPGLHDRLVERVAVGAAEVDPAEAERLLGQIGQDYTRKEATRRACLRMASRDLDRARWLAANLGDPGFPPLLAAVAARAKAAEDPRAARALLDSAFDELERLAATPAGRFASSTYPAAMAMCLPVAERIDPALVPDYLARALAARPPRGDEPVVEAAAPAATLAMHLARYDAEAAAIAFGRVAEDLFEPSPRSYGLQPQTIATVLGAAAVLDPRAAMAILDRLPEDPKSSGDDPWGQAYRKADARLTVASALTRPIAARRIEAVRTPYPDSIGERLD